MPGPRAEVVIDGDVGPLRRMLREGVSAMNQFSKDGADQLGGVTKPLEGIAGKFSALVGIIGTGAVFKEAIDESIKFTKETNGLARALGMSATEASAWNVALGDIYQDSEALTGAMGKLNRILAEDESKLTKLGIATRDANGQLKSQGDLFLAVSDHLAKFAEGTDRNIEGARIFGKSWGDVAPLLKLSSDKIAEASEKARELGLTLTEESTGRVSAYRAAMNDVGDVMLGLKNAIGQAVMPVLTRLGEWFSSIGPAAITVVRGAIGGLATAFMGLQNGVMIVWETIKSFVYTVAEPIRSVGEAFVRLIQGDFKGATEVMMGWTDRVGQRWSDTMERIADESRRTAKDIADLWGPGTATKGPAGGLRAEAGSGKSSKAAGDKSQMSELEAQLALQKQLLVESGILRQYEAQDELAFWRQKLQMVQLSGEDRLKIERKVAQLTYDIKRQGLERERQLAAMERDEAAAAMLGDVEMQAAAAKALLDNDQITKEQFLRLELNFEDQKYEIQAQALRDRLKLMEADPNTDPVEAARIKAALLELERQYQRKRLGLTSEMGQDSMLGGLGDGVGGTLAGQLDGLIMKTKTWGQVAGSVFGQVRQNALNAVGGMVQGWITGLARMLAAKLGFITQETTAQAAGSAATMGMKTAETTAVVAGNAAQAGAGAAASQASIPYVGPMLALAAMAAVFAAVMALGSRKSAAGGFDIPTGMSPLTQLHEEEMVLPRTIANPLRALIAGGFEGGGTSGEQYHNHYHAAPGETPDSIRRNARAHADAMSTLYRNGYRPRRG